MKTKIVSTIQQWVPESIKWLPNTEQMNSSIADYQVLKILANICIQRINSDISEELESVQEITNVINMLYQEGNRFTRNAIEKEFLTCLSLEESPASLKKHMDLLPAELRKGYIKTILEN